MNNEYNEYHITCVYCLTSKLKLEKYEYFLNIFA